VRLDLKFTPRCRSRGSRQLLPIIKFSASRQFKVASETPRWLILLR
jgi:hypothetical protein